MEYKHNTSSYKNANEENKVIKEIKHLKEVLPKAKRFSEIVPKIQALRTSRDEIWEKLAITKSIVSEEDAAVESLRKEMEVLKEGQNDVKTQGDKVTSQINKVSAEITATFAKKDVCKDEYYKAKYDYEVQRAYIQHCQTLQAAKDRIAELEQNAILEAERRAQQIKDLPHPYAKEIETCSSLVSYVHQLKRKAGLEIDSEDLARATQQNLLSEMNREQMAKKLNDGKLQAVQTKSEREEAGTLIIGGGKKQKGKKQKKVEYEDIFSLDVVIIQKFGLIGISPPTSIQDLDKKLTAIEEKLKWF